MVEQVDPSRILSSFGTKIKDLEEKHSLLKEKSLLLSQSFLKQEEEIKKELAELKDEFSEAKLDIDRVKEQTGNIIQELENFSRREDLKRVEKYMKIWEPLKFVKQDEVKNMINEAIHKLKQDEADALSKGDKKNYIN